MNSKVEEINQPIYQNIDAAQERKNNLDSIILGLTQLFCFFSDRHGEHVRELRGKRRDDNDVD